MPRVRPDLVERQERSGFVTVAEASRRSGVCERTIRAWTRTGVVKVRRVGPMLVFVDAASLEAVCGGCRRSLAEVYGATKAQRPSLMRELTLERDE